MENEHFWSPENFDNFPPRQRYFGLKVFLTVLQQGEIEPKTGPNYGPRASNCRATKGGIRVIFGWGFLLGPHFFVSRSGMNPSHPTIFTKTTVINNRGLQKAFWAFFLSQFWPNIGVKISWSRWGIGPNDPGTFFVQFSMGNPKKQVWGSSFARGQSYGHPNIGGKSVTKVFVGSCDKGFRGDCRDEDGKI